MLVNTTIFTEGVDEPKVMVETMIEMLNTLLQVLTHCKPVTKCRD
jgi:hypothetical protein